MEIELLFAKTRDTNKTILKRSIVYLGVMILCGTGKIPFHDSGYGYYCGLGGKGKPVDDTD